MRLTDLDPRWLTHKGERIGFVFRSPTSKRFWQTCFFAPTHRNIQDAAVEAELGEDEVVQLCNPTQMWRITAGSEFADMSIQPSIDGSAGGLWHGHITNGEIAGGLAVGRAR